MNPDEELKGIQERLAARMAAGGQFDKTSRKHILNGGGSWYNDAYAVKRHFTETTSRNYPGGNK